MTTNPKHFKNLFSFIFICLLIMTPIFISCGSSGGGGGDDGTLNSETLNVPADSVASSRIGSAGGEIEVTDESTGAKGVKIVVPSGAIAENETADFYIRVQDPQGAQQIDPPQLDVVSAAAQFGEVRDGISVAARFGEVRDGIVTHPFYATLLSISTDFEHVGPVLEFGPDDIDFLEPVELHIPFDKDRVEEEVAEYMTVLTGDFDVNASRFEGERETNITVDYDAGIIVVKVSHFSLKQAVKNKLAELGEAYEELVTESAEFWADYTGARDSLKAAWQRIAQGIQRPFTDLPDAPSLTDAMIESIVCSGYKPHIDTSRLPNPYYLVYYLSSPMDVEPREIDLVKHAEGRQYYENKRVVVGHEVALEDWVLAQPNKSVTSEALFAEAYKKVEGDVFQALLLSHNVLRGFNGTNRGRTIRGKTLQGRMTPLVGLEEEEEIGMRYHYFGMAAYSFIMRLYSHYGKDNITGLGLPYIDADEEISSFVIYFEECFVSADCITKPFEYAVDIRGAETGEDLVDMLFDHFDKLNNKFEGITLNDVAGRFGVDTETCISVDIQGEREYTLGEDVSLYLVMSEGTGTPYVEWFYLGELLMTGPEFFYHFDEASTYAIRVRVTDSSLLELNTSVTVTISDKPEDVEPDTQYVVWLHEKSRTCCPGDFGGIAPYQYHGTIEEQVDSGAIVLETFDSFDAMKTWVCTRTVHIAYNWISNWAKMNGYIVTNLPCEANAPWEP